VIGLDALLLERALAVGAMAVIAAGAAAALMASNTIKRLVGVALLQCGVMIALAAFGAPTALLMACALVWFAQITLGAALIVRLQEAYGDSETPAIDAADCDGDGPEHAS
jgi:energy-converting hydrogenase Eha subunit C